MSIYINYPVDVKVNVRLECDADYPCCSKLKRFSVTENFYFYPFEMMEKCEKLNALFQKDTFCNHLRL